MTSDPLTRRTAALRSAIDAVAELRPEIQRAARTIAACLAGGGTVFVAGNGGSAAEAQHFAAELTGRLQGDRERPPLRSVALGGDVPTLTAIGNDYGFEEVFARHLTGLARPDDVLIALSTSGASRNLVRAVEAARAAGLTSIGLLGSTPAALHEVCDIAITAPGSSTGTTQEVHLLLIHTLVELSEDLLGGST